MKLDFSGEEYMHQINCSVDDHEHDDDPFESAHLHSGIGNVAHVHRPNVVWGDLFSNLKLDFNTASFSAYINGIQKDNIRNLPIEGYSSLVLIVGDQSSKSAYLKEAVTIDDIKTAESMIESCGS